MMIAQFHLQQGSWSNVLTCTKLLEEKIRGMMMTQMEMDALRAVVSINRKTKDDHKIDWELRRYEIAKDLFVSYIGRQFYSNELRM